MTGTLSVTPPPLEPAVARGVTPGIALRGMLELAAAMDGDRPTWLANATVSVLGQLAVTPPAASQNVLGAVCAVAASRRSLRGLEPVLLSAALGTDPGTQEQATAGETWSRYAVPTPGLLTPVVDPRTRELVFLSGGEIAEAVGRQGIRSGLQAFLSTSDAPRRAGSPDRVTERVFANALALAAGAVGPADTDTGLAGAGASQALPDRLAAGNALLVEVLMSQPHPSTTGQRLRADGAGLTPPNFPVLAVTGPAAHPFWAASFRCSTTVPGDSWLSTLVVDRGRSFVLGALPDTGDRRSPAAPMGSGGRAGRGYLPSAVATRSSRRVTTPAAAQPAIGNTPAYVSYAPVLDPLTGHPDHYGPYPPGYAPPAGSQPPVGVPLPPPDAGAMSRLLTRSARTLQVSTEIPVGRLVEAISGSEYGAALNRATFAHRGGG